MNMDELYEVIERVNKRGIPLTPRTRFVDDLALDSLTVMELVADVEDRFDVNLPLNRLPAIQTIGQLADCIDELREDGDA